MKRVHLGLLLLLALLLPHGAIAAATPWIGNAHAAARLITAEAAAGSAARLDAGLEIRLAPGWHAYWRTPGDAGVPPSIDWTGSENVASATIAWPAPVRLVVSGLQNAIYTGVVVLPVAVALSRPGQPAHLRATVDYAACAEVCVPYHAVLDLAVPSGLAAASAEAPLIAAARARVPGDLAGAGLRLASAEIAPAAGGSALQLHLASDAAGTFRSPDLFIEGIDQIAPGEPRVQPDAGGRGVLLTVRLPGVQPGQVAGRALHFTLVDGDRAAEFTARPRIGLPPAANARGMLAIIAVALLGGLILNAMPCVLPVLSLKLLAVAAHASEGRRQVRAGLLWTAAGVLASFSLLAASLIGLKAAGASVGWGIQFQQPWFLAAMAAITALFAASLWDWLPIGLPGLSSVAAVQSRRPGLDAFLTGAFVTLLATPCSAPFVGTAIAFALSRGAGQIAAVFAALGLGMAAPYLLVAAVPSLVRLLPRPGAWMTWLRRVLGVMLAGTAAWLLWVLALVADPRAALFAAGALLLAVVMLAWRNGHPARGSRGLGPAAAAVAVLAVLVPALAAPAAPAIRQEADSAQWRPFDIAAIGPSVAHGKLVFVDVTAAWCLTCKVNALAVLDRAPVAQRLRAAGLVALRGDWTRPDPAITAYLQSFGRYGVPLDVVYGPGRPDGIALPELLTARAVTEAMRLAASPDLGGMAER